eukprot:12604027-Alexandrium_andersonii.AAC.1
MHPTVPGFSPASLRSSTCFPMGNSSAVSREASRRWCFVQSPASIVLGRSPRVSLVTLASLSEKHLGASLQP